MRGKKTFTVAYIGIVDADDETISLVKKYGILFDMLGILVRTSACTNSEAEIVRHMKNRYIFLPGRPSNGYKPDSGEITKRRIFLSPTALAHATANKYGEGDDLACSAAVVHSLMGYSLKYPADLVMVYYPRKSKVGDPRLSIIAAFLSKMERPVINLADEGWQKTLIEILADAGFGEVGEDEEAVEEGFSVLS